MNRSSSKVTFRPRRVDDDVPTFAWQLPWADLMQVHHARFANLPRAERRNLHTHDGLLVGARMHGLAHASETWGCLHFSCWISICGFATIFFHSIKSEVLSLWGKLRTQFQLKDKKSVMWETLLYLNRRASQIVASWLDGGRLFLTNISDCKSRWRHEAILLVSTYGISKETIFVARVVAWGLVFATLLLHATLHRGRFEWMRYISYANVN